MHGTTMGEIFFKYAEKNIQQNNFQWKKLKLD